MLNWCLVHPKCIFTWEKHADMAAAGRFRVKASLVTQVMSQISYYLTNSIIVSSCSLQAWSRNKTQRPLAHPPASLRCENMIPSPSSSSSSTPFCSFSLPPCCSALRGIRKHNSRDVHSHGTPRSLSSPLPFSVLHLLQASCHTAGPFFSGWASSPAHHTGEARP